MLYFKHMKESSPERFGSLTTEEPGVEPSRAYGQGLAEKLPALKKSKIEQEQRDEPRIEASTVVSTIAKGTESLQQLEKTHPRFWSAVKIAQWNNELVRFFETCASGKNPEWPVYALHVQKSFSQMEPKERGNFASIIAEMHAAQLLKPSEHESSILTGAEIERAHPVLDAGAGIDLLMYVPGQHNEHGYFGIQVKKDAVRKNPTIEEITTQTINAESDMHQRNSLERCQQGGRGISRHTGKAYKQLLVRMPPYEEFRSQELIDNRTLSFTKTPALDMWHGNMVEFFTNLLKGKK